MLSPPISPVRGTALSPYTRPYRGGDRIDTRLSLCLKLQGIQSDAGPIQIKFDNFEGRDTWPESILMYFQQFVSLLDALGNQLG